MYFRLAPEFAGSAAQSKMASTLAESSSELHQLFKDISFRFSPAESEEVVQSLKRIYGEQFNSLGNQDLLPCLDRLHKLGYVSSTNLTLIKKFVAPKSNNENDINERIESFKASHPHQVEPEKKLQGRSGEIRKITKILQVGQPPVVNLHGSAGVGKTTVAKEVCAKWAGKSHVFDLREAKDMRAIYLNIMDTLEINVPVGYIAMCYVVQRIHDQIEEKSESQPVIFLLDNVEQFTKGQGKEGKNLTEAFMQFLGKLSEFDGQSETRRLNILLTSRAQLNNSEKVVDYELEALEDSFSEKILFRMEILNVNAEQKEKLLGICKGLPLLLEGTGAILRLERKSASDLIAGIEKLLASQGGTGPQVKYKVEEDAKEKPFNFQEEEGVDAGQTSIIKEMFDTLPSDSLRVSAVTISMFCGPFSASTAANVLGISPSEAVAQLEGLVNNAIIHVVEQEAKELMYDIHPLLKKYAESIRNDAKFCESYTEAKRRFYEHFMSKMKKIAGFIESSYVKAFNEFARDRPNYEFAIDISLLPEYFSIPGEYTYHENALILSLFNTMLSGEKQTELFHYWAEMCKDDGQSGMLFLTEKQ